MTRDLRPTGRAWLPAPAGPARFAWWAGIGYAALLLTAYNLGSDQPAWVLIGRLIQYLPLTAGGALALWLASRRTSLLPGTRAALRWLGGGLGGSCLGMACYIYAHEVTAAPRGLPRIGDALFLTSYLAILVGLLRLPRRRPGTYDVWKVALDALVVLVGLGLVGWHLIVVPTTVSPTGPLDLAVRIAYPLLDIGFLFALNTVLLAGGPAEHRRAFGWTVAAILAYAVAESIYQVMYYGTGPVPAPLERTSELFFTIAYLCFLGSGLAYLTEKRTREAGRAVAVSGFSPLPVITTAAVAALVAHAALTGRLENAPVLVIGLVSVCCLLLVRQGLTIHQNVILLREQAQREGDTRVAALVRHASDLIIVTEPDGRIRFASPSAERILGMPPERLIQRPFTAIVHPEDHALLPGGDTPDHSTSPMRLQHADGGWVEVDVIVNDLSDEPAVGGVIYVGRDLTERNALELRLRQSQKMEAVGRLAGGVAHDFNNLLTTILASTDLLLEHELPGEVHADLGIIRQAAGRAAGLTGQLLAFSRQERLQRRSLDLATLADETVSLLRRLLGVDVSVRLTHEDGALPISGDANQLAQVVVNLALNARDAMPQGGALTITTGTRTLASAFETRGNLLPAGEYAVLVVCDTGGGMDEATLARIFEPFFTTKAAGKGTGLGLATTQRIVEQHDGGILVTSTRGAGTTITIFLPLGPRDEAIATAPAPLGARAGTETILVVEDEASVRDVTARILTRLGYHVLTAAEAGQARRLLADRSIPTPHLMVTDVMMPGMTGPELAERVATTHPAMRILFISGYPGDELGRLGLRAGEVPFLQKPFSPVELAGRIRELLDRP